MFSHLLRASRLATIVCAAATIAAVPATAAAQAPPPPAPAPDSATIAARRAALVSDLRNVATAQEAYFADAVRYARTRAELRGYVSSNGVTLYILVASPTSHSAVAVHRDIPDLTCGIAFGTPHPITGADTDGAVTCRMPDGSLFTPQRPGRR